MQEGDERREAAREAAPRVDGDVRERLGFQGGAASERIGTSTALSADGSRLVVSGQEVVRAYDLTADGGPATYHGCTTVGSKSGKPWCATTASYDADGLFGLCFEHGCPAPKRVHREAWRPLGQTLVGTAAEGRASKRCT